jgi:integral membrane protein
MKALFSTSLGKLRIIAFLEGISFILLLAIAMPLKYYWGLPEAVRIVGMAHGILFLLYIFYVILVRTEYNWSLKTTFLAIIASVLPFGTFVADVKLFRE